MNILDLIALAPLVFFMVMGFRKGILKEIIALIGLLFAILASLKLTHVVLHKLSGDFSSPLWPYLIHVAVFVLVLVVFHLLSSVIEGFLKAAQLHFANRIFGAMLGLCKGLILVGVLFWLTRAAQFIPEEHKEDSISYAILSEYTPLVLAFFADAMPWFKNIIAEISTFFDELAKQLEAA